MRRSTFLLGVGCQKGGTAWLHRYLDASPQSDMGFRKEYHVWDALDLPTGRLARERIEAQGGRRAAFLADPERYFAYFAGLLDPPAVRLTADITPGYAGLSVDRLAMICEGFAARGVRVAGLFLMRDPVERIWSAVRMDLQRGGDASAEAEIERLVRMHNNPMYADRTRYEHTLDRLEQVLDPADLCYGFYERLFDPDTQQQTLRGFTDVLGVDAHPPDPGRHVNASPKHLNVLPDDVVARVARHFAPTYAAVATRFPDLDLSRMWPSARWV